MPDPVDQMLPRTGVGYVTYKPDATRYGTAFTLNFITQLAMRWHQKHPAGPRLQIGDLSPKGGGACPNGRKDAKGSPLFHKSHRGGVDFDVQIIRGDGKEAVRSVEISDPSTHAGTQELVDLIETLGAHNLVFIFTAKTEALRGEHIRMEREHTYHLHVRLKH